MALSTITQFADTAEGEAFYRAYDAVLSKWPEGTTSSDVESRFGSTRVNSCGPEGAPPVLLLPGGGATSTVWFDNIAALSRAHRVHAVDLMGDAGRSAHTGDAIRNVDDLLDWLESVVDSLGLARPSIVAHSYGAIIALAYALRTPERVDRLMLLDPNSCFAGMKPRYLLHALPIFLRPTEKRERVFLEWETEGAQFDPDWMTLLARGAADFPNSKTIVPRRPTVEALSTLRVDTTVVLAPRSKVHDVAKVERSVRSSLSNARIVTLSSGTHHTLPMEPSAELNAELLDALDR
ncbi:MAG: alpha/beta hydrolase [Rhodococcus sp.]|nr:alpha/beta hydrolase [Rhodococcus sp. (in: high G+C Gram-positive bacteria)]